MQPTHSGHADGLCKLLCIFVSLRVLEEKQKAVLEVYLKKINEGTSDRNVGRSWEPKQLLTHWGPITRRLLLPLRLKGQGAGTMSLQQEKLQPRMWAASQVLRP